MPRRLTVLVFLIITALVLSSCKNAAEAPSKALSGNYSCTLSVSDSAGSALFGGELVHADEGYTLTLSFPEDISGLKVTLTGTHAYGAAGDLVLMLSPTAASKLRAVTDALDFLAASGSPVSASASSLYGKKVTKFEFEYFTVYCDGAVPLAVTSKECGVRAEITGFSPM